MLKVIKEDKITVKPEAVEDIDQNEEIKNTEESNITEENIEDQAKKKSYQDMINNLIQESWNLTSNINSIIISMKDNFSDCENYETIIDILNKVNKDITVDIGMIYSILDMIDNKTTELLQAGSEKVEEIIAKND